MALLWLAGEAHFRGCVDEVAARYPPIAVSAFSREDTGPLQVAYDAERTEALEDCSRVPLLQHAPYVPTRLGRPGQWVRLSPETLAACVSNMSPASIAAAAAAGTLDFVVIFAS